MPRAGERQNDRIISALLCSTTVQRAAEVCGISERTIYARLKDPAFMEAYNARRKTLIDQSAAYLQAVNGEALAKMRDIMNDEKAPKQTQLNAAEIIARYSLKLTEQTAILDQIEELKRKIFDNE